MNKIDPKLCKANGDLMVRQNALSRMEWSEKLTNPSQRVYQNKSETFTSITLHITTTRTASQDRRPTGFSIQFRVSKTMKQMNAKPNQIRGCSNTSRSILRRDSRKHDHL